VLFRPSTDQETENCDVPVPGPTDLPHFYATFAVSLPSDTERLESIPHRKERDEREGNSHSTIKACSNDLNENCDVGLAIIAVGLTFGGIRTLAIQQFDSRSF
jgi:hypothetical protein